MRVESTESNITPAIILRPRFAEPEAVRPYVIIHRAYLPGDTCDGCGTDLKTSGPLVGDKTGIFCSTLCLDEAKESNWLAVSAKLMAVMFIFYLLLGFAFHVLHYIFYSLILSAFGILLFVLLVVAL